MLSQLFLLVCGLVILTVLCVFGYLFVLRQRELVQTMHALGARRSHPFCFFAFGALALGLLAACPGILLSRGLEDYVLTALQEFAARYQQADLRFSSSALTVILPLAFEPKTPEPLYYLTAGSLILGSPAKVVRPLTEAEIESIRESMHDYMEHTECYHKG